MACTVQTNNQGEITKVLNSQGQESKLYIQIAKSPIVENALEIYKNLYSDKFARDKKSHQILKSEENTTLDDMTKGGELVPSDFYGSPQLYADLTQKSNQESWKVIQSSKNSPEKEITIYRNVPKDINSIENGDWVTLSKTYAKEHSSDGKVISQKVKVGDVVWDGNDINEFAYFPQVTEVEPLFGYQLPDGSFTQDYKTALLNTPIGAEIKAGFQNGENFTELISVSKSTNKDTQTGFINAAIEEGLLSPEKIRIGNQYKFAAEGESDLKKAVNAELFFSDAQAYLGTAGIKKDLYSFEIQKTKGKIQVFSKSGEIQLIDKTELDSLSLEQIQEKFEFADDIIAGRFWQENTPAQRDTQIQPERITYRTEEELQLRLLNFLSKLGVQVTSISNYIKNYNVKNGVNPSAQALADITNRVVAVANGVLNTQDLTEETAHFIIEAMPAEKTADILRNIHKSKEWLEFSDIYRKIYQDEYSGEQLEEAVRREVLGKILANSIADNFAAGEKTEIQKTFIQKAQQLLQDFIDNIRNYFKPEYIQELNEYLDDAQNLLLRSDLSAEQGMLNDSPFRYYNVDVNANTPENKLILLSRKITSQLQDAVKDLKRASKSGVITRTDELKLKEITGKIENTASIESVASMVSITNNIVNYIKRAIDDSVKNGKNYLLSHEEVNAFNALMYQLSPSIGQIKNAIKDKTEKEWVALSARIQEVQTEVDNLRAAKQNEEAQTVRRLVDEILSRSNSPESFRQYYENWIDRAAGDIDTISSVFGTLTNSKDGLVNLFGTAVVNMHHKSDTDWLSSVKKLLDTAKKNGVKESELSNFQKDGFIVSEYDFAQFNKDLDKNFIRAYKEVTGEKLTDEEILKKRNAGEIELDVAQQNELLNLQDTYNTEQNLFERPRIAEYYKEEQAKWEQAKLSQQTKIWLRAHKSDVAAITQLAQDANGRTDKTLLSLQDQEALKSIERKRLLVKSYIVESGQLKQGLRYVEENGQIKINPENNQPLVEAIPGETLSDAALISLDLNRLDNLNEFTKNEQEFSETFLSQLQEIDDTKGREEALKFLELNAHTSFNAEFWNQLSSGKSVLDRLQTAKENGEDSEEVQDLINDIRKKNFELRQVLKLWSNKNNPAEIDELNESSKDTVKTYVQDLAEMYERSKSYTKGITDEDIDESTNITEGVSGANESYNKKLQDRGIYITEEDTARQRLDKLDEQITFARENMTDDNSKRVFSTQIAIEDFRKGKKANLPLSIQRITSENEIDLMDDGQYIAFMKDYAEARLLPYYKNFAPASYNLYREGLKVVDNNSLSDFVKNTANTPSNYIDIAPHYSFYEDNQSETKNPNYRPNAKVGYRQPSLEKYSNPEFQKMFGQGVKTEGGKIVSDTAQNQRIAETYNAFLDFHFAALDAAGMENSGYNYFTAPQVRKTSIERMKATIGGFSINNLRLAAKDSLSFTPEEMIKGDNFGGMGKVVPRMYIKNLDDPEDLSTDLLYSSTLLAKEAYLRRARLENYGVISSIFEKAISRDYGGKAAESTRTYKMLESALEFHLFGVHESVTLPITTVLGNFDGAKMVKQFSNFIKFKSLGLNPIVSATGFLTMKSQQVIEGIVQQHVQKRPMKLGSAESRRIMGESFKEFGKINTQGRLNLLGQYFGAFHAEEGLKNSQYGFVSRLLPRTAYGLFSAAAFPIFSKNLLSILHDFRIIDGKMMTFNDYKAIRRPQGISLKQVQTEYNKMEDSLLYDFIDTKDGQVTFNKKLLGEKLNLSGEALDNEVQNISNRVRQNVKNLNMIVDSALPDADKTTAQRNFLLNLLMPFRGYVAVISENRLKRGHFNPITNQYEIGSYRGVSNFVGQVVNEYRTNGGKVVQAFRDAYKGTDETWAETDARNISLRRAGVDFLFVNTLMLASLLLRGLAENDDTKDLFGAQITNLLLYKTVTEVNQSGLAIYRNYADIIEKPIMAYDSAIQMGQILNIMNSDPQKSEKAFNTMLKFVPAVNTYQKMGDINKNFESLRYFQETRQNTFNYTVPSYLLLNEDKK